MKRKGIILALTTLLLLQTALGALFVGNVVGQETCQTEVLHDSFRTDEDVVTKLANNASAESIVDNTRVTIEETSAFFRITAENPNSYCVDFVVQISTDAIPPAEIPGSIRANDGEQTATWDAKHDFNSSESYTEVRFVLQGGESATFAPSELRVVSLAWVSQSKERGLSLVERVKAKFSDSDLEENRYELDVDEPQTVKVDLVNPETGEKIEEWHAVYSMDGDRWHPVSGETDAPVYVDETDDVLKFTFKDADATVEFVAEPGLGDKAKFEMTGYMAGVYRILDNLPFNNE